ncbi:MAG: phosphopantetheine-binding protein [Bacteroidales bacterium]|nr:phosphopantetheine-binding protein [Bacteroidales bacterium]
MQIMSTKEKLIKVLELSGIIIDSKSETDIDLRGYITDSLQYISTIVSIENEFDIEFPDEVLKYDSLMSLNAFSEIVDGLLNENN